MQDARMRIPMKPATCSSRILATISTANPATYSTRNPASQSDLNSATDGRAPEWPKVVISNLQIPADQMTLTRSLTLKASDCIRFDAVLWHDAKRSERFSSLSLCAPELPKQSNNFVLTWKRFSNSGKTTGQIRSDGPTPPYSKLPSDPAMERWLMNQFGLYYVGSLLTLVGYDPNFTVDDRRFWIRNIKG
jgi:hypothetical protein